MHTYNYCFTFSIIGDQKVGKSCLTLQFIDSKFRQQYDPTYVVDFGSRQLKINEKQIKIILHDLAGYPLDTRAYYRFPRILVFDVTIRQTFESLIKWLGTIDDYANQVIIVGNKIDLEDRREVSTLEAQKFAQKLGLDYFETSAKTGENVEAVFESFAINLLKKIENRQIDPHTFTGIRIGSLNSTPPNPDIKSQSLKLSDGQNVNHQDKRNNCF